MRRASYPILRLFKKRGVNKLALLLVVLFFGVPILFFYNPKSSLAQCLAENDIDFDCVSDALDNCPAVYNPGQEDGDNNGVGDVCDFSDDFESGDFNSAWTEVTNYEVILDPTGERPVYVASVIDLAQGTPPTLMVKDDLSLGPGTIARVFFYEDGAQHGDDHTAVLDGVLGSIGIVARYSLDSFPSSEHFYIFDPGGITVTTNIHRTVGWHEFRFTITSAGASAYIDGAFVGTVPEIIAAEIFGIESNGGDMALWDDVAIPPILEVPLDIKPGSDPNCFNNDGHGVIPVAILSSAEFDATQVDPSTVVLNGQAVRAVGKANTQAHIEDVNGDGLDDLVVQIEDMDGTYVEGTITATLTGETSDGTRIRGTDTICIVP